VAFDPRLGDAFSFDADDLAANREGRLSSSQELILGNAAAIARRGEPWRRAMVAAALLFAAVAAGIAIAQTPGSGVGSGVVAGVILAGVGGGMVVALGKARSRRAMLEERTLHTTRAALKLKPTGMGATGGGSTWRAQIGQVTFLVDARKLEALHEGERYRIHFLRRGAETMPLSLERAD
jgi:hypothetical protein